MNVNFTESAAEQAKVIIAGEDPGLELRVYVQGGGCSGFQYGFTLDTPKEEDWVFETNGVKLIIDPMSVSYTHLRAHETREDLGCRRMR